MDMDLTTYKEQAGYTRFTRFVPKTYFYNQNFRRFMAKYIPAVQKGVNIRKNYKAEGITIPSFITASITERFTENSVGEGARVMPSKPEELLTVSQWRIIFEQSVKLGIHMIVLMCGSSVSFKDVLEEAALFPQIIFPTIIDSRIMNDEHIEIFEKNRNIMPVLNINTAIDKQENAAAERLKKTEEKLKSMKMSFGAFITVTSQNLKSVTTEEFVSEFKNRGYESMSYMERILAEGEKDDLLLSKSERRCFRAGIGEMSEKFQNEMIIFLITIDRNHSDDRDSIHVNPDGGVESYYDLKNLNLKSDSMLSVFKSISSENSK